MDMTRHILNKMELNCLRKLPFSLMLLFVAPWCPNSSILIVCNKEKNVSLEEASEDSKYSRVKEYCLICLHGFLTATITFGMVMAVPMMPIGDLIVISFTSPIFSVILDTIILKRPLTFLSVALCILIGEHGKRLIFLSISE